MNSPSIITKVYDLLKHLILYVIKKIPKDQRFTLGNKIQINTQEVLEKLIEAYYTTSENKKKILQEVNSPCLCLTSNYLLRYSLVGHKRGRKNIKKKRATNTGRTTKTNENHSHCCRHQDNCRYDKQQKPQYQSRTTNRHAERYEYWHDFCC